MSGSTGSGCSQQGGEGKGQKGPWRVKREKSAQTPQLPALLRTFPGPGPQPRSPSQGTPRGRRPRGRRQGGQGHRQQPGAGKPRSSPHRTQHPGCPEVDGVSRIDGGVLVEEVVGSQKEAHTVAHCHRVGNVLCMWDVQETSCHPGHQVLVGEERGS